MFGIHQKHPTLLQKLAAKPEVKYMHEAASPFRSTIFQCYSCFARRRSIKLLGTMLISQQEGMSSTSALLASLQMNKHGIAP